MKKQVLFAFIALLFAPVSLLFAQNPTCGGTFTDPAGPNANYANNSNVTTTITPDVSGNVVTINFISFDLETNFDRLKVYNGPDITGSLLANLTGSTLPQSITSTHSTGSLTFVFTSDSSVNKPGWVADVVCGLPPTCPSPSSILTSSLTSNSTVLNWTENGTATSWEILTLPCNTIPTASSTGTIVSSFPSAITGLNPGTCYRAFVRSICNTNDYSNWSSSANFTTPILTCSVPTTFSVTNLTNISATINWANSTTSNQWEVVVLPSTSAAPTATTTGTLTTTNSFSAVGLLANTTYKAYVRSYCTNGLISNYSAGTLFTTLTNPIVVPGCGELFFDNGGTTSNYGNSSDNIYTICPNNPGEIVTVTFSSFDLESNFDGLYVFNGNTISAPQISSGNPAGNIPGGLTGAFWGNVIPGPFTSSSPDGCLTFRFISDNTANRNGWVANVECLLPSSCILPTNLSVSNITHNAGNLNWTENGTATQWEVLLLPANSPAPLQTETGITTSINSYQFSNLTQLTAYKVYVKSVCDNNTVSLWSNVLFFTSTSNTCINPTNINVNLITENSATLSWVQNGSATQWEVLILPSNATAPTASTSGTLVSTNTYQATGLITGATYIFYIRAVCSSLETSNWTSGFSFAPFVTSNPIVVNTSLYTSEQLVNDVLINNPCVSVSNVTTRTGTNFNSVNGIGYFTSSSPEFPISSGIVLSTGNALNAQGPNSTVLSDGNSSWLGDSQLFNYIQGLNIDPTLSTLNNASVLEFDFSSLNSYMSFNFLFASDEYGTFQCTFADSFAFFLTDLETGITTNIALIPGTTTPVSVVTIRNNIYNNSCNSVNPAFFNSYTEMNSLPGNGATNFNGITVKMTASADIIPNHNYHIKLVIADRNDSAYDSAIFIESGTFAAGPPQCVDKINLVAFIDANSNGVKDDNEVNFTHGSFTSELNNSGVTTNVISPSGVYTIYDSISTNVYDFGYQVNSEFLNYYSSGSITYNDINIPTNSGTQTFYFPIVLTQGYNDVTSVINAIGVPRPGFNYVNKIAYRNLGIVPTSGVISFTKDDNVSIVSVSQNGINTTTNGFTFDYTNLQPQETRYIYVTLQVNSTVALGTLLSNSVTITSDENDINLTNNVHTSSQITVNSYDPNDKMESHGDKIMIENFTQNDYLYYTIRFQNMGTANAINIKILDDLDPRIDEQSIRMIDASHNYILERVNNQLTWKFDFIQLASHLENEEASKGYVTFKVKLKPGFAAGDIIPNYADIYFDNNAAITTNTFNTEFVSALNNSIFNESNFVIVPNPANSLIQISLNNTSEQLNKIRIYDVLGKTIQELNNIESNLLSIDVSHLSKGVYLVEITTENNLIINKKLVIN